VENGMSIATAKANLQDATKKLMHAWDRARAQWDDDASREFAKEVIEPILPRVNAAMKGIDHVGDLVAKVKRECGDG
jgi:predicted secreted Zn-dependent protease